jgi:hypothetical protein
VGRVAAVSGAFDSRATDLRAKLLGAKLSGLLGDHLGARIDVTPAGFGAGSAVIIDGSAWVLIDGPAMRRLGAALAWVIRQGATSLNLIAEDDGSTPARRARGFDFPIAVWTAQERTLIPVQPDDALVVTAPTAAHLELVPLIEQAGAVSHVEHGVVTGEVRGLEVCRVVDEPTTGHFVEFTDMLIEHGAARADRTDLGVMLEVGVGANDREAFQMLHGHVPTLEALAGVVSAVSAHRTVAARQHPLNRMAPERFLRWQVEQEPDRLDLRRLTPAEPPVIRQSMKHAEPCAAVGTDVEGRSVAVVFSSGVDLDLIPFVADFALGFDEPVDRLLVAAPEHDLVPISRDLARLLRHPVELVAVEMH